MSATRIETRSTVRDVTGRAIKVDTKTLLGADRSGTKVGTVKPRGVAIKG